MSDAPDYTSLTTESLGASTPIDKTAAALIEQVWGNESGPSVAEEPAEAQETTEEAAKLAEPAPEPEKPKDERAERVAARIALAKKAELRAAQERQSLQAQRAEHQREQEALAERAKQLETLEAAKMSPSKLLELAGKSPKEFLEALSAEHEPEEVAKRAMAGTLTEVQKLQARIDAMEKADQQRKAQEAHARTQQITQEGGEVFTEFVAANAEKYPALVETWTPAEFVREAFAVLDEVVGKDAAGKPVTRLEAYQAQHDGNPPSEEEIAEFLEYRAQPRFQARSEWRARIGTKAQPPGQGTPIGQATATQQDSGSGPRTLTSRDASIKASAPKPWSQEAADEESLRILRAAMR